MSKNALWFLGLFLVFILLFVVNSTLTDMEFDATIDVIATRDLYGEMMGFDYATGTEIDGRGMTHIAMGIREVQRESEVSFLLDAGGSVRGNFILDYILSKRKDSGLRFQKHPMLKVMEYLEYDASGLSYRELGYGADILHDIEKRNKVKFLNANIYDRITSARYFQPYTIVEPTFKNAGRFVPLKVAIVGLMNPWASPYLGNVAEIRPMDQELESLIPELRKAGVGLIFAVVHLGGLTNNQEIRDRLQALTQLEGLNLVILGFEQPGTEYNGFVEIINRTPVIAGGAYAHSFGLIKLSVNYKDQEWQVTGQSMDIMAAGQRDPSMEKMITKEHQIIKNIIQDNLATATQNISNYFAMVYDNFSEQLVNEAQIDYISKNIPKNQKDLPVVSLASPMAYQQDKNKFFVTLNKGPVSIADVLQFYNRAGTLLAIQITGRDMKDYLEWVSQAYVRVNEEAEEPQYFLNTSFPLEYFGMLNGVTYGVDLTQPSHYRGISIATPNARRIKNLEYKGRPVRDGEQFLLVLNSSLVSINPYLAQLEKNSLVWDSEAEVRSILLSYIAEEKEIGSSSSLQWKLDTGKQTGLHFVRPAIVAQYLSPAGLYGTVQFIRRTSDNQAIYRYQPRK